VAILDVRFLPQLHSDAVFLNATTPELRQLQQPVEFISNLGKRLVAQLQTKLVIHNVAQLQANIEDGQVLGAADIDPEVKLDVRRRFRAGQPGNKLIDSEQVQVRILARRDHVMAQKRTRFVRGNAP